MSSRIELSTIDGERVGQVIPLDPSFTFTINEPSTITFDMSNSHRLANIQYIEPYATDFAFYVQNTCLMEGMITAIGGEDESNFQVAGSSWEHYLERRHYPFIPTNPTLYRYAVVARDVFTIVQDVLTTVQSLPYSLQLNFNNGTSGITRNLRIEPGDTESVLEIIGQLSEQKPAFDFEIVPLTREFKMYAPQKGAFKDMRLVKKKNVSHIRFDDEGLEGNSVLTLGAGTSSKLMKLKESLSSMAKYRRHDHSVEYGEVIDPNYLNSLATGELDKATMKDLGLIVTITPKYGEDVLLGLKVGDTVNIQGDIDYTTLTVDDTFRITQIEGSMSRQNNFSVELTVGNANV